MNSAEKSIIPHDHKNITDDCLTVPSWVSGIPHYPFVSLQIQMLIVFCATQLLHQLFFKHIRMPHLVSQCFAGIALGPSGLGTFKQYRDVIFPPLSFSVLKCITMLSYTLSLFIVAAKMDFTIMRRTGNKTLMIALLTLTSALALNSITQRLLLTRDEIVQKDLSIATTSLPVTAHPVIVQLISDIGLVNSELGRLALSVGLCAEITSIMFTMGMQNILPALGNQQKLVNASLDILGIAGLLLALVFVFRPFMRFLIKLTPKDRPIKDTYVFIAVLSMLLGSTFTSVVRQFVFLGAYMVGGALPAGPPLGSAVVDKFDTLISDILYPFFISTATMKIDFSSINFGDKLVYDLGVLIAVTFVTKVVVCFLCGVHSNMSRRDALSLAAIMNSKGFLELATYSWLKDMGGISTECFSVLSLHVIVMAAVVPLIVKLLYDPMRKYGGYQIRDIMHLKQNAALRMVNCVIQSENITSITNLLRILNPTKDTPIVAHVLHLMTLAGRCQPLFISHDIQKRQSSNRSYSDEVIWHFNRLQHFNKEVLSTHVFTALSHPNAMHEYICTLALDKVVSLIVLPFHRRFGIDGSIDHDDVDQRLLNSSVLNRSPSSVAVLVDRAHVIAGQQDAAASSRLTRMSSVSVVTKTTDDVLSVAVIFIGGVDDREALALAKRMSKGTGIKLTVIRLASPEDEEFFLNSLDSVAIERLHETKFNEGNEKIVYVEIMVKDGADTALKLRSIVLDFDLIIVGRRFGLKCNQTSGLSESSEIEELGVLGDLLASPDLKCRTSVLVLQQQQHFK